MHMNNRDGIHQRRYLLGDIYCGEVVTYARERYVSISIVHTQFSFDLSKKGEREFPVSMMCCRFCAKDIRGRFIHRQRMRAI